MKTFTEEQELRIKWYGVKSHEPSFSITGRIATILKNTNRAHPTSHIGWLGKIALQEWIDKIEPEYAIQVYFDAIEEARNKPHSYDYYGDNLLTLNIPQSC